MTKNLILPSFFSGSLQKSLKAIHGIDSLSKGLAQIKSLTSPLDDIQKALKPIQLTSGINFQLTSGINFNKSMYAFDEVHRLGESLNLVGTLNKINGLGEHLSSIREQTRLFLETFKKRDEEYEGLMNVSQELANSGWLLTYFFDFDDLDSLADCAKAGQLESLCEEIKSLYKNKIDEQVGRIIEAYPEREFIVEPAYRAHARGEYGLSIMGFFSQADGICSNNTGKELFQGWGEKRLSTLAMAELEKIEEELDFFQIKSDLILRAMMWTSVKEKLPISFNLKEREQHNYEGLNRNIFVHGSATADHATEENSLKAFSILSFVAALLQKENDE